jgi:SAM-dependent methyltransferase
VEPAERDEVEGQLRRQVRWLRGSWLWLLRTRVLAQRPPGAPRPRALDVGCGPGHVMDALGGELSVEGVDRDPDMVAACAARGLPVTLGDASALPFDDGSFDVAYCSFLLMWADDPVLAVGEMARVSRGWVLALAEPDYGGRVDHPPGLEAMGEAMARDIRARGGDPFIGRRLREVFSRCGLEAEVGVHPGVWTAQKDRGELEEEWRAFERTAPDVPDGELGSLRDIWHDALADGTLLHHSPIFYALGRGP